MAWLHRLWFTVVFLGSWDFSSGMVYQDYGDGYDNVDEYGPCYRPCDDRPPRICYYKIAVEMYPTLSGACGECEQGKEEDCLLPQCVSADGVERTVFAMNRRIPGPGLHLCKGDKLMTDLEVLLPGHQETFHWHGILQKGTPYMDGVPMVTQCPVESGQTFRYNFIVPEAGTFFYHSHSGINKANGVAGALVVREPKSEDPHGYLYDKDRAQDTIILQDWFSDADAEFLFPGSAKRTVGQRANSILCNGRGRTFKTTPDGKQKETKTILSEFYVEQGLRYRFRVINAGSMSCPMEIIFDRHSLLVIESDGVNLQPVEVGRIITFSGERYSFIVQTNQPVSAYWIHMRTTGFCGNSSDTQQWAILRYKGWHGPPPSRRPTAGQYWPGPVLGDPGVECGTPGYVCPTELRSMTLPDWPSPHYTSIMNKPDLTVVMPVGFYVYDYPDLYKPTVYDKFLAVGTINLAGYINNISFLEPSSCLLTNPGEVVVCDGNHLPQRCKGQNICECTHLVRLPLGKIVDILIIDSTSTDNDPGPFLSHPMHIHGHTFLVLNWGEIAKISDGYQRVQTLAELARRGELPPPQPYSPIKDTISLPGTGYTRIRIFTDNPVSPNPCILITANQIGFLVYGISDCHLFADIAIEMIFGYTFYFAFERFLLQIEGGRETLRGSISPPCKEKKTKKQGTRLSAEIRRLRVLLSTGISRSPHARFSG